MTNQKFKNFLSKNKPLLLAIALSVTLHFALLRSFIFNMTETEGKPPTLTVRLVKLPAMPLDTPPSAPETTPSSVNDLASKPLAQLTEPEIKSEIKPAIEPTIEPVAPKLNTSIAKVTSQSQPQQTTTVNSQEHTLPVPALPHEPMPPTFEQRGRAEASTKNYKNIETDFEVYQSTAPNTVSINRVTFSSNGTKGQNETYLLTSTFDANISENQTKISQHSSEGRISNQGLKPNYYVANNQRASFAWSDGAIEINNKYEKLPSGTQDELSYMYQFMFFPPLDNNDIVITDGVLLQAYHFSNLGEQLIPTKMGEIKTVHLFKDGEEKVDLWLAVDYQYLPVKIRKTAKDNSFTEQTATKLSTALADIKAE